MSKKPPLQNLGFKWWEHVTGDEDQIKDFIKKLCQNVLVLDSGARGATTSFVENGQGDVLIAWENEAYLSVKDYPDDYEIITPSISILAQPSVAVVDTVVDEKGTRDVATEYLNYLYSDLLLNLASKLLLYKIYGKIKGRENVNQGNRETGAGITCDRFQSVK